MSGKYFDKRCVKIWADTFPDPQNFPHIPHCECQNRKICKCGHMKEDHFRIAKPNPCAFVNVSLIDICMCEKFEEA